MSPTTLWIILNSIESLIRDKKIQNNATFIFQHLKELNTELIRLESRIKRWIVTFLMQVDLNDILITSKKFQINERIIEIR